MWPDSLNISQKNENVFKARSLNRKEKQRLFIKRLVIIREIFFVVNSFSKGDKQANGQYSWARGTIVL